MWTIVEDHLESVELLIVGENNVKETDVDITKFNLSNIIQACPSTIENGYLSLKDPLTLDHHNFTYESIYFVWRISCKNCNNYDYDIKISSFGKNTTT